MGNAIKSECSSSAVGLRIPLPTYYRHRSVSFDGHVASTSTSASTATSLTVKPNSDLPKRESCGVLSCFDPLAANTKLAHVAQTGTRPLELPDAVAAAFKNPQGLESQEVRAKEEER